MTKRTTDEWQTLLDGTTPGPWAFDPEPSIYPIESADGRSVVFQAEDAGMEPVPGIRGQDGHLIAAAPEAVAEVVRLREDLEALRRNCIESAEVCDRYAEVEHVPDIYVGVAEAERDTADIITRILDGSES